MRDELRQKLIKKNDQELRSMVGSPGYAYWAQELAVEVLVQRGHSVALPLPPVNEVRRRSRRALLVPLCLAAAVGVPWGAYLAYQSYCRDVATRPVLQFAERLRAVATALPTPVAGAATDSTELSDAFGAACAGPMATIGWQEVVGFVTLDAVTPPETGGLVLARWTLVVARPGRQPSELGDRGLRSELVDHYLSSQGDAADDAWEERLPTPQRLAAFRYVAISRAFNVVWPHITRAVASGGDKVRTWIGDATPMTAEGELGRATLDITVVKLDTKAVVCHGRIDNAGPTSFVALGRGADERAGGRDLPGAGNTA